MNMNYGMNIGFGLVGEGRDMLGWQREGADSSTRS